MRHTAAAAAAILPALNFTSRRLRGLVSNDAIVEDLEKAG